MVNIGFKLPNGEIKMVKAEEGLSILEVAHQNDVPLEGACEGSLACSTCHVILEDENVYKALPKASGDEEDMLDLAFGLTKTSRLGCQILVTKELENVVFIVPKNNRNI
jgi:ferredoxin